MSTLQTPTARTIIYVCCIGGLLVIHSALVMFIWNVALSSFNNDRTLTFLEGAGLTAFAYVVVVAVRYGRKNAGQSVWPARSWKPQQQTEAAHVEEAHPVMSETCQGLSAEDRERLKRELVANCGCVEKQAP
jgi:hypothetical protein